MPVELKSKRRRFVVVTTVLDEKVSYCKQIAQQHLSIGSAVRANLVGSQKMFGL